MSPILQGLANGSVRGYGGYLPLRAAGSFESIATVTGNGSSATLTFSSIPSTYQHLQIRGIGRYTGGGGLGETVRIRFNSDTGANYVRHDLTGNGTSATAGGVTAQNWAIVSSASAGTGNTANVYGVMIVDIHDYKSTAKNKVMRNFCGWEDNANAAGEVSVSSNLWLNTSAITSIQLITANNAWDTSTRFALYGIKGTV